MQEHGPCRGIDVTICWRFRARRFRARQNLPRLGRARAADFQSARFPARRAATGVVSASLLDRLRQRDNRGSHTMAQRDGLDRRAFLKNAGLTAVIGAVGSGTPLAAAASAVTADATGGVFDFDTPYNRIGTDCTKWDRQIAAFGMKKIVAGMGIADMDFRSAPCITKALTERMQHENWGYLTMPQSHVDSIVQWNKKRYHLEIAPESIVHSPSLHPAILSVLRVFSPPGTKVIVQTPTYNAFFTDIRQVGCKAEENKLKLVNGRYEMDFEAT